MKIMLFANTEWYLYNHRLSLAKEISERGNHVVLVSPPGPYAERLIKEGFEWRLVPLSRSGINPLFEWKTYLHVLRLYRQEQPDLVHHFTHKPILYGSLAARSIGNLSVINSITGLGFLFVNPGLRAAVLRVLIQPFYRLALNHPRSKVIFQNPRDRDTFLRMKMVSTGKTVIIRGSGVDIECFKPQVEPEGDPVILMASRMLWDKGVADLIKAARTLRERGVRARVVLVGGSDEGNPASIPDTTLRAWHEERVVEWLGHQDDMPRIYATSHIVVLPSYGEGLPLSLIEAAAMGKPLVATDLPGCREIVRDGQNGILVSPRDPAALAEALSTLVRYPQLRRQMGERGRAIVLQEFTDEIINRQTLEVYDELLGD